MISLLSYFHIFEKLHMDRDAVHQQQHGGTLQEHLGRKREEARGSTLGLLGCVSSFSDIPWQGNAWCVLGAW